MSNAEKVERLRAKAAALHAEGQFDKQCNATSAFWNYGAATLRRGTGSA